MRGARSAGTSARNQPSAAQRPNMIAAVCKCLDVEHQGLGGLGRSAGSAGSAQPDAFGFCAGLGSAAPEP